MLRALLSLALAALALSGCSRGKAPDPRYPERPVGCDVKLFHEAPTMKTDNIGPVMASCATDVSDADCVRQLMDEACKLGGDVVWGVPDKPTLDGGRHLWFGRSAHTKSAAAPAATTPEPPAAAAPY
jgi:hypothetical protein